MATKKGSRQRFSGCFSPDHSPDGLAGHLQPPEGHQKQKQSPERCWSDSSSARAKPERSHERRTRVQQAERPAFPSRSRSTCIRTLVSKLARQQSTNKTTHRKRKAKANCRGVDGAQRSLALKVDWRSRPGTVGPPALCQQTHSYALLVANRGKAAYSPRNARSRGSSLIFRSPLD